MVTARGSVPTRDPFKVNHDVSSETRNQFRPCSWIEVTFLFCPDMWGPHAGVRRAQTMHMKVSSRSP